MLEKNQRLYELIERSSSFDEVRSSGLLPDPDADDGYYFVSYCHKDYKQVVMDIVRLGEEGAKLWYDRGLESGKSWVGEVKQKISSYYCKGVIFYISKNYLNSPSCLMELDHFLKLASKSALFITLDNELSDDGRELASALMEKGYAESHPSLTDGGLFLRHKKLSIEDSIKDKLNACKGFSEPELLEYTYLYGIGDEIVYKIIDIFLGRIATVSGVADKNVRRVVIPSHINKGNKKYKVAGISSSAFMQCDLLEEVVVPDGWTSIDNHAFVRCPSLKRVVLGKPKRLFGSSLGVVHDIFDRCPNASIVFNGKLKYRSAFKGRNDITEAVHTADEIWFGECFAGCQNLTRALLSRKDNFSERMFSGCGSLREIVIPKNNVTTNLVRSFEGCSSLKSIALPKNIRFIGERSFYGCSSLCEVRIPKKVKEIARDAFARCESIEKVIIDAKKLHNYDDTPYKRTCLLDEIFPSAKMFYLRHVPKNKDIFVGDFTEVESDIKGYKKYVAKS